MKQKKETKNKSAMNVVETSLYILGGLQLIIGIAFFSSKSSAKGMLFVGLFAMITAYLLTKKNKIGVYFSWVYAVFAVAASIYNKTILAVLLFGWLLYYVYKMQKEINEKVG